MKTTQINIRDPYILVHEGKYYLYGTRSATCWGPADGFDCYVSEDKENWDGPIEIFHRPEGFFADQNYWAPECIYYEEAFYLITTLGGSDRKKEFMYYVQNIRQDLLKCTVNGLHQRIGHVLMEQYTLNREYHI